MGPLAHERTALDRARAHAREWPDSAPARFPVSSWRTGPAEVARAVDAVARAARAADRPRAAVGG